MKPFIEFLFPHPSDADPYPYGFSLNIFLRTGPSGWILFGAMLALFVFLIIRLVRPNFKWVRRLYWPLALVPLFYCIFMMTKGMFWVLDILKAGNGKWTSWMDLSPLED